MSGRIKIKIYIFCKETENVPIQTGHRARSAISLRLTVTTLQRETKEEKGKL